jgi:hypothetical protein
LQSELPDSVLGMEGRAATPFTPASHSEGSLMNFLLNNWQNLNHAKTYGGNAFFDLWADGNDDKRAREFSSGDTYTVLSRAEADNVAISVFKFESVRLASFPATPPRKVWVLQGTFVREEVLAREAATKHHKYARFFNRLGHVNQWSVLKDA